VNISKEVAKAAIDFGKGFEPFMATAKTKARRQIAQSIRINHPNKPVNKNELLLINVFIIFDLVDHE
jgi:hypothetical protein